MTRTRRARPELSESWEDVDDDEYGEDSKIYTEDDERAEVGREGYRDDDVPETPRSRRSNMRGSRMAESQQQANGDARLRRSARFSEEPQLVMPSSPDASTTSTGARLRASTPHFRLNQRSLTSDAGKFASRLRDEEDEEEVGMAKVKESPSGSAVWSQVLRPLLAYVMDVVGIALQTLKPLLGYALLLYILVGAVIFGLGFLTNSINNALTPVCRIPGASWMNLPFCPTITTPESQGPAEFDKLIAAQSQFEDVLQSAQVGANLPMDMKRSEASIRDLRHVVEYSTLPSRNELVFEFAGFIETARRASQDLGKFASHIGRATDHILSTNRWTLSTIEGVKTTEAGQGALSKWIGDNLNIFSVFQPVALSRDLLLDQYLRHTSAVEEQILTLIDEAQALLNILDNLDGRLDVISSIAARDGVKIKDSKEELFAELWTKLGGNRKQKSRYEQQIHLLKEVGAYRRLAWAHVTTTIVKLQKIRDTLEDLRERVAMPETIGERVPLEVHIQNINLGIERLEMQRDEGRRLEREGYEKVFRKAEEGMGPMGEGRMIDAKGF
jgi:hypothetical protein